MGVFFNTDREYLYNKKPLSQLDNRDEYFLIEALGTVIPEADIIFYSLLTSKYRNQFPKIDALLGHTKKDIYNEIFYFAPDDLIRYLHSPYIETLDEDMSNEEIAFYWDFCRKTFFYQSYTETMMFHALMEAAINKYVKSIVIAYPWEVRDVDVAFLHRRLPKSIIDKLLVSSDPILNLVDSSETGYTTIITNNIHDVITMIHDTRRYKCDTTAFLLRNHSKNVSLDRKTKEFKEEGDIAITGLLIDENGVPTTRMTYGRFQAFRFEDMNPNLKIYNYGG